MSWKRGDMEFMFFSSNLYLICLLFPLMRYQFDKGRYMYNLNFISLPMLVLFSLFDVNGVG